MARLSWSWRFAMANCENLSRNAKAVAQALSMHMTDAGENCFPSLSRLEIETGMSRKTLIAAIDELLQAGWLTRRTRASNGSVPRGQSVFEYSPAWPAGLVADGGISEGDGGILEGDGGNLALHIRKRRSDRTSHVVGASAPTIQKPLCEECTELEAKLYLPGTRTLVCFQCWSRATGRVTVHG